MFNYIQAQHLKEVLKFRKLHVVVVVLSVFHLDSQSL